jgi:hypothetical protein
MVLEDGSDEDDALEEEHGDVEKGMYTPEMDPTKGPVKLIAHQVAVQKAATHTLKGSSDEDGPTGSEWI